MPGSVFQAISVDMSTNNYKNVLACKLRNPERFKALKREQNRRRKERQAAWAAEIFNKAHAKRMEEYAKSIHP